MADTTTQLNAGSGGDKMDESQVLQSDGVTSAKRPRVVIGGDAGFNGAQNDLVQPVCGDPGASPAALPAVAVALVNDAPQSYIDGQGRPLSMNPEGRLRVIAVSPLGPVQMFDEDQRKMWGGTETVGASPWENW